MSYIEINNIDFYNDINSRKEFIENILDDKSKETNHYIDNIIKDNNKLILNNYQKFITNFINPNTKFNTLLLVHSTGVGKTITSISTAINFINIYKEERQIKSIENDQSGMIYILGFTKSIFKRELMTRPEFGIVTKEEIENMNSLKKQISKYNLERDMAALKELKIRYSARLKSKKGNGFFKFIGYKKLANSLIKKIDLSYKLQISDIKTEDELQTYIDMKIIEINYSFIKKFAKSLLICDEIHNVYNSLDINNWGMCLKIIFNYFQKSNEIRVLLLSATPINNKPIELISLLELLNPNVKINKDDIFDNKNNITKDGNITIKKYIMGKISYLKDMNLELYPSKQIMGEKIPGIDYLNFIKCPMSELQFKTYKRVSDEYIQNKNSITKDELLNNNEEETVEYEDILNITDSLHYYKINLESNNRYLNDFVIPDPDDNKNGLFTKHDIIKKISNADKKWKAANEIDIIKDNKVLYNTITGNCLSYDNIKKYSTKYYKMLNLINDIIIKDNGKIFIYHNFVQVSGINLIGEILKQNGILEINEVPVKFSRCNTCYDFKYKHEDPDNKKDKYKKIQHELQPIRFISVSSLSNKINIEKKIEVFNMDNNVNGSEIRIILGSQAIKESYDLKAVQNLIMLHQPVNISTIIQIFGRAIRKNSHINLPSDKRNVSIYILVSSMPEYIQNKNKSYIYTFEEMKYKYKINIYKVIKSINNIFVENAIDLDINYNINFPKNLIEDKNDLYHIETINKNKLTKIDYNNINNNTFISYYSKDEINICKYIIKRLFIEYSNIWTYNDLFDNVKKPYFKMQFNTSFISENSFVIALDFLTYTRSNTNIVNNNEDIKSAFINNLFSNDDKIIYDFNNNKNVLLYINKYYVLTPINNNNNEDNISQNIFNNINMSIDILYRDITKTHDHEIDINEFIKNNNINDYNSIKKFFINKFTNVDISDMFNIIYDYDYEFHLNMIQEIIEYFFNIYTDSNYQISVNHALYSNLLYFYNKFNIILFANKLDNELTELYSKYIISTKLTTFTVSDDINENYNYNNLISSLEDELTTEPKLSFSFYKRAIAESNNYLKNRNKINKIFDYLLPIGHIFDKELKFYNPKKFWFSKLKYNNINFKFIDNPKIIGYLEKLNVGFDIVFKLKTNNSSKKITDKRLIQLGVKCINMDKPDLYDICNILKIDISSIKNRKNTICDLIKFELIRLELEERKKKSNIRYFYFYWENII